MWYACDVPYVMLYVRVNCFAVVGCAVSGRYLNVCYGHALLMTLCEVKTLLVIFLFI